MRERKKEETLSEKPKNFGLDIIDA